MVYIDHNLGTLVKDAFVVDAPAADVLAAVRERAGDDPDLSLHDVDLAVARSRIEQAIEMAAATYAPFETDRVRAPGGLRPHARHAALPRVGETAGDRRAARPVRGRLRAAG